jgi:hypothetical protein
MFSYATRTDSNRFGWDWKGPGGHGRFRNGPDGSFPKDG